MTTPFQATTALHLLWASMITSPKLFRETIKFCDLTQRKKALAIESKELQGEIDRNRKGQKQLQEICAV